MKILITGAMGFIGTNAVEYFCKQGHDVVAIDNMSRNGTEWNYKYLKENYKFRSIRHNVCNQIPDMEVDVVIHLAGQVGVQASIKDPVRDFKDNIVGTMSVLEFARSRKKKPLVIFSSTNKVYGELHADEPVKETTPLDFHTPYGCSKGSADQYVLDYSRIYDIPTVVFRQSCIYGDYQLGTEEQGWLAWFLIADKTKQPITIYGDGNQIRDVLHVEDLIRLYDLAIKNKSKVNGQAYNIGGGPENTLSLNQLVEIANITTDISFDDWRPADQKYYVSDITKIKNHLGWEPKIDVKQGVEKLKKYVDKRWPLGLPKYQ